MKGRGAPENHSSAQTGSSPKFNHCSRLRRDPEKKAYGCLLPSSARHGTKFFEKIVLKTSVDAPYPPIWGNNVEKLAEGVRFELTEPLRVRQFSRLVP